MALFRLKVELSSCKSLRQPPKLAGEGRCDRNMSETNETLARPPRINCPENGGNKSAKSLPKGAVMVQGVEQLEPASPLTTKSRAPVVNCSVALYHSPGVRALTVKNPVTFASKEKREMERSPAICSMTATLLPPACDE